MSRVLGGRYEILEKIGEGGMSVIYKARCKLLHRFVAIKILKPEFLDDIKFIESFRRESQAAASLIHPNIVNIYDVGMEGKNIHYIVMEYVEGRTLAEIIASEGKLSDYDTIEIGKQVASALAFAHKNHIIHRDVKPHNILISDDGVAKITDFGIAKAMNSTTLVAPDKSIMGSVHYFSPEQARGGYVDDKSDIYSLGVVLYESITGRVPFDGENPVAVAMMHINNPVVPPSQYSPRMSPSLENVILKAMDKYQVNRFASADEFIEALDSIDLDAELNRGYSVFDEDFPEKRQPQKNIMAFPDPTGTKVVGRVPFAEDPMSPEGAPYGGPGNTAENYAKEQDPSLSGDPYDDYEYDSEYTYNGPEEGVEEYDEEYDEEYEEEYEEEPKKKHKVKKKRSGPAMARLFGALLGIVAAFFISRYLWNMYTDVNEPIQVPTLLGQNYHDAETLLQDMGLALEVTGQVYSSDYEIDQITNQSPLAGDRVKKGFTIKVSICKGAGVSEIPHLVGATYDEAVKMIHEGGFIVGQVNYEDSQQPKDVVLKQSPDYGEEGGEDTKIDLVLSSGETPGEIMPDLLEKTEEEAKAQLNALGVTNIDVKYEFHDVVQEKKVIQQSVSPNAKINDKTKVTLTVSQGPDPAKTEAGVSGGEEKTVPLILDYNKSPNEVFGIKINLVQDGQVKMVHDKVHYKSDNGESVEITGSGTATVQVYFDDKLAYEGKLNFETGTFEQ